MKKIKKEGVITQGQGNIQTKRKIQTGSAQVIQDVGIGSIKKRGIEVR